MLLGSPPPLLRPVKPPLGRPIRLLERSDIEEIPDEEDGTLELGRMVTFADKSSGSPGSAFETSGDIARVVDLGYPVIVIGRSRTVRGSGGTGATGLFPSEERFNWL